MNPTSARGYSDSYIAEHVHTGGVIRARLRKILHRILIFPYAALYYFNTENALMERDENILEKHVSIRLERKKFDDFVRTIPERYGVVRESAKKRLAASRIQTRQCGILLRFGSGQYYFRPR